MLAALLIVGCWLLSPPRPTFVRGRKPHPAGQPIPFRLWLGPPPQEIGRLDYGLMDVEVDLYSGRPNPRFRLEPTAAAELMRRLAALPPSSGRATLREGLGYRGLRIDAGATESPVAEIVVSDGVVLVRDRGGTERLMEDTHRRLERWLVEVGTASLDPSELAVLREDLGRVL
jgi:hypothetical protein